MDSQSLAANMMCEPGLLHRLTITYLQSVPHLCMGVFFPFGYNPLFGMGLPEPALPLPLPPVLHSHWYLPFVGKRCLSLLGSVMQDRRKANAW